MTRADAYLKRMKARSLVGQYIPSYCRELPICDVEVTDEELDYLSLYSTKSVCNNLSSYSDIEQTQISLSVCLKEYTKLVNWAHTATELKQRHYRNKFHTLKFAYTFLLSNISSVFPYVTYPMFKSIIVHDTGRLRHFISGGAFITALGYYFTSWKDYSVWYNVNISKVDDEFDFLLRRIKNG